MYREILNRYKTKGSFSFNSNESLKEKCNAPTNKSGIYLIFKIIDDKEFLIYIGSSGQIKNGVLTTRKSGLGGMKDRIVNGYHPNKFGIEKRIKRHKSFPLQMQAEHINELRFYWWVTYEKSNFDYPTEVEALLLGEYKSQYGKLPAWHKQ